MSAPVKKAAETAFKQISKNAKTSIPKASRSVSAAEASSIAPADKSSTETSMPWEGWFSSFVKDKVGDKHFEKLRRLIVYQPDDIRSLSQMTPPDAEVPLTEDGKTKAMFRYPSPGSQPPVRVPSEDAGTMYEDPFVTSSFTRDTMRRHQDPANPNPSLEKLKISLLPEDDERVQEYKAQLEEGPKSSPGNKGMFATGKSDFDEKGLRASMSANHAALEESLDASEPDHLPKPDWWNKQDEVVSWYKERELPVPFGATGYGTIPREGRIARW
uniref:Uncharacterized protein n=1 Tax=Eucampia antarctica TaxID=49252 RepID=A0A7S2WAZ1_9STRA|mmetsp:Transcript_25307/g.24257  ORF Transcript_25307/g.24257 Transcript_25307/m.24257 type:complete len:272 (+) Transcript_25307:133-948(+)|eukprot:CAMPEP_0197833824 /NCGR_PEP_ID=MMETSP1437-20131217/20211_1 /TAXON_ID=49252 ORGANISM="Eucampia antarctica, Strain CCMP1452" /NCGR_SAMPLE_ID=MMETSP1437 /ASSEMBLY_ACC=CAM_ASM_001096 /LENGTH=271 /DNA_ID=CAMNT_0043438099 /DNA_START=119 /DNA_END=931 /DNA_ORIENTATION=+